MQNMSFQELQPQQIQNQNQQQSIELYQASYIKLKDNQIEEALRLINDALKLYPLNAKAFALRGQLFLKNYRYDQALEDLNQAVYLEPQKEETLYYRATAFFRKRMLIEALTDCENGIQINPNYAMLYMRIGSIKGAMGNQDEALQYYNKAIEVDENCCFAYINRGVLCDEMGNKEQALLDYNKAIQLDNTDAKPYCNRGILYKEIGNIDQALQDYSKAIQLDPNDANSYNTRGTLYKQMGNKEQALLDYNKAIQLDPSDSNTYNNRGNLYKEDNQNDLALSDYLEALNLQSDHPLILANLGDLYYSEQNYHLSADYYVRALASLDSITPQKRINWSLSEGNIIFIKEKVKVLLEIQNDIGQLRQELTILATQFKQDQSTIFEVEENINKIEKKLTKQLKPLTESSKSEDNQQELHFLQLTQEDLKQIKQQIAQLHQIISEQNQRINNLEEDNKKLKLQDGYQIQESMSLLQKVENKHQFIYYQALFWKLYYYLQAMQQISSELFQMNRDSMIESKSEKVLDIVQKVFNVGSKVAGIIPIGGDAFELINEALDYAIESKKENKFKLRLNKLTNILKCYNIISPVELENEVKIAAIQLAKKQQIDSEGENNQQFDEFVNKLRQQDNQEYEKSVHWKNGTKDALVILKYLEDFSSIILEAYDKKLREIFLDAIEKNTQTKCQILQQQNAKPISQVVTASHCCSIQ